MSKRLRAVARHVSWVFCLPQSDSPPAEQGRAACRREKRATHVMLCPRSRRLSRMSVRNVDSTDTCEQSSACQRVLGRPGAVRPPGPARRPDTQRLAPRKTRAPTHILGQELVVHPRELNRAREVVAPVEVEQGLRNGAKDARAARAAHREPHGVGRGVVHDEGRRRRKGPLAAGGVVEGRGCEFQSRSVSPFCASSKAPISSPLVHRSTRAEHARAMNARLKPNASGMPGVAKSSSSSLRMMPVLASMTREPKMRLTVDVRATAPPQRSMVDM